MHIDVERIMKSVKVDDGHIILGEPKEIIKYGVKLIIRQVNWWYKWRIFSYWLAVFLEYYNKVGEAFGLPDTIEDLEKFRRNILVTVENYKWGRKAKKALVKVCKFGSGLKIRWAKKVFTIDDWMEVFLWVYVYNVLGVKKNSYAVSKVISKAQSH
jgi:hypothetical protein